jgi:hypothetical protein
MFWYENVVIEGDGNPLKTEPFFYESTNHNCSNIFSLLVFLLINKLKLLKFISQVEEL